jgi:hypothetical protein
MLKQIGMSAGAMKGNGTSRDFKAFLHGRRDGEVAIVNVSPKVKAGKREVIDKKFSDSEQFKATEEAEIKE